MAPKTPKTPGKKHSYQDFSAAGRKELRGLRGAGARKAGAVKKGYHISKAGTITANKGKRTGGTGTRKTR